VDTQALKEGETRAGFQVIARKSLPEYRSIGIWLTHRATGAEVYHIHNADRENLFAFTFRTPPHDNTGVPHITEHAVLSGSRRFPIKDPFVTLLKGSMQTFLNAMTFPDKTVYPASSLLEKDFFNLMRVYGDAVFFPLLKKEVFHQEGHHVEFRKIDDLTSGLKLVGIVYNEMKGKYSSQESVVSDWSLRSLFPDTPYGFDSGGSPESIPDLTYDDFVHFHQRYYHPSNCRVFLYGNIPTVKHLEFLQADFFSSFTKIAIGSTVPHQPRWTAPQRLEMTYPVKEGDALTKKSSVTINWLTVPITDPFSVLSLEVLSEVLLGNAGSPLRKDLIDSKLGEDLAPASGLETELKEVVFTAGLRGTDPEKREEIENVIVGTLQRLRDNGIPEDVLQAALHRVEFENREITGGGGPYGLRLMRKVLRGWLHDAEPETTLEFDRWINELKETVSKDKRFFSHLIEQQLLLNPHRSTLLVRPDPAHSQREEGHISRRLKNVEERLSEREKHEIASSGINLKRFQEAPDPPEMLAAIPSLTLHDIPREVERIPCEELSLPDGVPLLFHDVFTRGVVYIDFAFNTEPILGKRSCFLPLFGKTVCGSGLPGAAYDEAARLLSLYTGGFTYFLSATGKVGNALGENEHIFFRAKILREHLRDALHLITRLLGEADFEDRQRLSDLVLELKNELRASLLPSGHQFVSLRAASSLSHALKVEEGWKGLSQIFFIAGLSAAIDEKGRDIASSLEEIRRSLISRRNLILNVTTEESIFPEVQENLSQFIAALPEGSLANELQQPQQAPEAQSPTRAESLVISSNVGYVAKALPGARFGTAESACEAVLAHFLRTGYLWERIRMRGGAYGAFALSYSTEGVLTFITYRDPNIVETLQAFRESLEYVQKGEIDKDHVEKAIIGTIGKEDRPQDPGEKGLISLKRRLCGITDALRQSRREVMLNLDHAALSRSAQRLLESFDSGFTVVMSNREAIQKAGTQIGELNELVHEVPL